MAKKKTKTEENSNIVPVEAVLSRTVPPRDSAIELQWCPLNQDFVRRGHQARRGITLSRADLSATERLVEEAGFHMEIQLEGERAVKIKDRLSRGVCWIDLADLVSRAQYQSAVERALEVLLQRTAL